MQNIAYGEYLPTILGVDYMQKYKLVVAEESKYDPTVDSTIFNRSGHLNQSLLLVFSLFKLTITKRSLLSNVYFFSDFLRDCLA